MVSDVAAAEPVSETILDRDQDAWVELATQGPLPQRLAAVVTLAEFGVAAHNALVPLLADPIASVRYRSVVAIDRAGPLADATVAAVYGRLEDDSAIVRVAAAETLLETKKNDAALGTLVALAHHENFRIRLAALWAMVRAGDTAASAWPEVSDTVDDKNNYVRNVARQLERRFDDRAGAR